MLQWLLKESNDKVCEPIPSPFIFVSLICFKNQCNNVHQFQKFQLCAGGEKNKNACRGDSGGPLMYSEGNKWTLTGIVSFGPALCGKIGFNGEPAVYTRVAGYIQWINHVLLSLNDQDQVLWQK